MPIKYVIYYEIPSAVSPHGNRVTTFLHYNLKASTITHVVNIISNDRIGKSDGRCVQKTVTYSTRTVNSRLLGIPRYN